MKFFALIASVAAIKLQAKDEIDDIFHMVDTSGNGQISPKELKAALIAYAEHEGHKITRADKRWVRKAAKKADENGDRKLNQAEFRKFAIAFAKHYGIGDAQLKDASEEEILHHVFNAIDTSGDGEIQPKELKRALK